MYNIFLIYFGLYTPAGVEKGAGVEEGASVEEVSLFYTGTLGVDHEAPV